jgi:hypothetical protein
MATVHLGCSSLLPHTKFRFFAMRLSTVFTLVVTLYASTVHGQTQKGDTWAETKMRRKGRINVLYSITPGMDIVSKKNGIPDGLAISIIRDFVVFAKIKYGITIETTFIEENDFFRFIDRVKNSQNLFGASSTSVIPERKRYFKFTYPFVSSPVVLFSHKLAPNVSSWNDLVQKKILTVNVEENSYFLSVVEEMKKTRLSEIKIVELNYNDLFTTAIENKNSLTIISMLEFITAFRNKLPVKVQPISLDITDDYAFIMPIKSDWDEPWNEFLNEKYVNSPHYREAISKFLGASFLDTFMKIKRRQGEIAARE